MLDVKLSATDDGRIFATLISTQGISGLPVAMIELETKKAVDCITKPQTGTFPTAESTTLITDTTTSNGTDNIRVFNNKGE